MAISAENVKELRAMTGAGILDCKKALEAADGDMTKAIEVLQKRNQATAVKKMNREAKEGKISAYVHGEGRIGVLVEVSSETDFVARSELFDGFVKEVCLQIAALSPKWVKPEEIPADILAHQREIFDAQVAEQKKPPEILAKITEGKLKKWYGDVCLLEQTYIRDDKKTFKDVLTEVVGRTGENINVRRFVRYELGEGI